MGINYITGTAATSIDENNQDTENWWVLDENPFRTFTAQDAPGFPGLYKISYRRLQKSTLVSVVNKVNLGIQTLCQTLSTLVVTCPCDKYLLYQSVPSLLITFKISISSASFRVEWLSVYCPQQHTFSILFTQVNIASVDIYVTNITELRILCYKLESCLGKQILPLRWLNSIKVIHLPP